MALDQQQLTRLIFAVADTRDEEIDCDECLAGMAEFAEQRLVGADVPAALERIEAHILFCPECAEEYEVLLNFLRSNPQALP